MSKANPFPRKYISTIQTTQDELRFIAKQARLALEELESGKCPLYRTENRLRDIETKSYKVAYELSEIDIADDCTSCPLAPPVTKYQVSLAFIAKQLLQIVAEIRKILGELDE